MPEGLTLEEENIIKDTTYLFRLKEELNCTAIKHIRNLFRLEKETKEIKGRILRDIKNLFEHEEEKKNYKPVIVNSFHSNNYIDLKVRVIEKNHQKKNILIKLNHTSKIINVLRKCAT